MNDEARDRFNEYMRPGFEAAYKLWRDMLASSQCYICEVFVKNTEMYQHFCECSAQNPQKYLKIKMSWSIIYDLDFDQYMSVNFLDLRENEDAMPKTFEERVNNKEDRKFLDDMRIGLGDVKPVAGPIITRNPHPFIFDRFPEHHHRAGETCHGCEDLWNLYPTPHENKNVLNEKLFEAAPCYLCHYDGIGYFMSVYHACAFNYHGALRTGEMKPGERLYVVAGSYEEAEATCDHLRLSRTNWWYVKTGSDVDRSSATDIRHGQGIRVLLTGTYWQRADWPSLNFLFTDMLRARMARYHINRQ